MAAILVPCGVRLRSDFNTVAPTREKVSDGWIGDTAHQQETSDHNDDETGNVPIHDADRVHEVHAIDVDKDLNQSDLTMEKVVQFLLGRCRSGAETRLRYIIYNRRIWEASNGWKQRAYTGPNPHDKHAHFSFSYDTGKEASTVSWHLEDIPVALTADDKKWLSAEINKATVAALAARDAAKAAPADVWAHREDRVPAGTGDASMGAALAFTEARVKGLAEKAGSPVY